jgi:hypothetical protein
VEVTGRYSNRQIAQLAAELIDSGIEITWHSSLSQTEQTDRAADTATATDASRHRRPR